MRKIIVNVCLSLLAAAVVAAAVLGPEFLARYQDKKILNRLESQLVEEESEGYRYSLSSNEKLYILSKCLNSQSEPGDELNNQARMEGDQADYQELTGSYAFVVNRRDITSQEITDEKLYETCNRELAVLKELGVLPDTVRDTAAASYDAVRYSAIDIPEPRNNVSVWKLSLATTTKNANKQNRLLDAYLDADTGKLYEFYVRTELSWEDVDTDAIIAAWSEYMGLTEPQPYEPVNPLQETTPYFSKYFFEGMEDGITVVTVGFYEGINELFLKVSR